MYELASTDTPSRRARRRGRRMAAEEATDRVNAA
jgi:hypothetical protein